MVSERAEQISQLRAAIKEIWAKLPPEERDAMERQAREGHEYLLAVRDGTVGDKKTDVPREMFMIHSLLHDDPDGLIDETATIERAWVGGDGEVFFGDVEYDSTDVLWAYVFAAWEDTKHDEPPFNNHPVVAEIPDTATLAILGDWGGNNSAARQVAEAAKALGPDYFVHVGDVYYAGTDKYGILERDYQRSHFLDVWPGEPGKSYALNSNHDMYAHGTGYYNTALKSPFFLAQKGCGYFALYNDHFRFVGLDSAYYDHHQSPIGFLTGDLGPTGPGTQAQFLCDQAAAAAKANQTLVLLTHHNGLSVDGTKQEPLWHQVGAQLAPLAGAGVVWYWGHEHVGAVYKPQSAGDVTILPRCCGHSCIPWGIASDLESSAVSWFEDDVIGPGDNYFVTNGFATLTVDGATLHEAFYAQNGARHWHESRPSAD